MALEVLLFFLKRSERMYSQHESCGPCCTASPRTQPHPARLETPVPRLPLMGSPHPLRVPLTARATTCHCPGRNTRQHGPPPQPPGLLHPSSHEVGGYGLSLWPTATGNSGSRHQLLVRSFLPLSRRLRSNSVSFHSVSPGTAIRTTHQNCVDCGLGPSKEGKAVRDHLEVPAPKNQRHG